MTEIFNSFLNFDLAVFEWVQSIQNPILTAIMVTITTLGDEGIIFILLGLVLLFTKKHRKAGFAILTALVVMLICNNLILKELFARTRPYNLDETIYAWWHEIYKFPEMVHKPSSYSFPSGHTSSAFAAALALVFYNRKIGIPTIVFAALMGFSRIYVEVHYCTDVIGAVIVSFLYAVFAVLIVNALYPKVEPFINKVFDSITAKFKKKKA